MTEVSPSQAKNFVFSLRHLLTLTALIAVTVALVMAYLKNRSLSRQHQELTSISSEFKLTNINELAMKATPKVADDFLTWQVNVPVGQEYVLRLGIGPLSEQSVPEVVGSTALSPGRHRVTLFTGDSPSEDFNYVVYVDGKSQIEKKMGHDWMPSGWSSARSANWPRRLKRMPASLQLGAQIYHPNRDFGTNNNFNGQSDNLVTRLGYRLWIDRADAKYPGTSPFLGLSGDPKSEGIGLSDGLRLETFLSKYQWQFTRPSLESSEALLRIEAEFVGSDGRILSSQSQPSAYWEVRDDATRADLLSWHDDPSLTTQTAFLHAKSNSQSDLHPVVEMKWESGSPDEVSFRLADTPANDQIIGWRLRILGGDHHLLRMLKIGEQSWMTSGEMISKSADNEEALKKQTFKERTFEVTNSSSGDCSLEWRTNEELPLQIVERVNKSYANLALYSGLPVTFGMTIPSGMKPTVRVNIQDNHPQVANTAFPEGPIFKWVQLDIGAVTHDWIKMSVKLKDGGG